MRKKNLFGNEYEILYDTIRDHDTYGSLRVSLEVDRTLTDRCVVHLNGRPIGVVMAEPQPRHRVHYTAFRFNADGPCQIEIEPSVSKSCAPVTREAPFTTLGQATAAVISDFA